MSEARPSDASPAPGSPDPEQLRRQAEALRQVGPLVSPDRLHYSGVQKFLVLLLMLSTIGASIALAVSGKLRRAVLARAGGEWARLYQSDHLAGIHKLPAPPPRRVEPQLIGAVPLIYASTDGVFVAGEAAESDRSKPFVPPSKNAQFESAFQILKAQNPAAAALAEGRLEGRQFVEWRPLQAKPPLYYVDLLATDAGGKELHYIWSVNLEDNRISAQSQLARDLEARK